MSGLKKVKTDSTVDLVVVKWEDATHQEDESKVIGTMIGWTTGFLIYKNKKEIALCMEVFEDGAKRNITAIPRGMVKRITKLASIPIHVDHEAL